jgi:hypothetical protein
MVALGRGGCTTTQHVLRVVGRTLQDRWETVVTS